MLLRISSVGYDVDPGLAVFTEIQSYGLVHRPFKARPGLAVDKGLQTFFGGIVAGIGGFGFVGSVFHAGFV